MSAITICAVTWLAFGTLRVVTGLPIGIPVVRQAIREGKAPHLSFPVLLVFVIAFGIVITPALFLRSVWKAVR